MIVINWLIAHQDLLLLILTALIPHLVQALPSKWSKHKLLGVVLKGLDYWAANYGKIKRVPHVTAGDIVENKAIKRKAK